MKTEELFCKLQTVKPIAAPTSLIYSVRGMARQCLGLTEGISETRAFLQHARDYLEVRQGLFAHLLFDQTALPVPWTATEYDQLQSVVALLQRKLDSAFTINPAYSKFQSAIYRKAGLRG